MPDPHGASVPPEAVMAEDRGPGFFMDLLPIFITDSLLRRFLCVDFELRTSSK